jgi:hypothetical protein
MVGTWCTCFDYFDSDVEFQKKVSLPIPTQECLDYRINPMVWCLPDTLSSELLGDAKGSCDNITKPLMKVVTQYLNDISHDPNVPTALHNPAYYSIKNFQVSGMQLSIVFHGWMEKHRNKPSHDPHPREDVCEWVAEKLDLFQSFVPQSCP